MTSRIYKTKPNVAAWRLRMKELLGRAEPRRTYRDVVNEDPDAESYDDRLERLIWIQMRYPRTWYCTHPLVTAAKTDPEYARAVMQEIADQLRWKAEIAEEEERDRRAELPEDERLALEEYESLF